MKSYEEQIRSTKVPRDENDNPIGWSPAYMHGFVDAANLLSIEVGSKADAEVKKLRGYLLFLFKDLGVDGLVGVQKDRYEYAADFAAARGREEANEEDEGDGVIAMLEMYFHNLKADDEIGVGVSPDTAPGGERCGCGERPASACPGAWEPGCDLGANAKHAKVYAVGDSKQIDRVLGFRWAITSEFYVKECHAKARLTDEQYNNLPADMRDWYAPI